MAGTLTDALHDLDLPTIVRSNKDMERIRVALEANTQPEEALKIVDSLTRFVVERTGAQLTQEFAQALRDLTELQETVLNKYESSVKGSKVAPADLKSELQPALTKRSELFDKITRITSEEGQDMVDVDVDELLRGGDEGDRPSRDVPDRPRDDPEFMPEVPNLPAASRAAAADVAEDLAPLQPKNGIWRLLPWRRPNRPYSHEQFALLRALDPIAASRGYEVRLAGWDYDDPAGSLEMAKERGLDMDGIRDIRGGRFEMLEAKYSGEELGPNDELMPDHEASMRGQFSRYLSAMKDLGGQAELRIVTNSDSLADFMTLMLKDLAHTNDLDAAGIHVQVVKL